MSPLVLFFYTTEDHIQRGDGDGGQVADCMEPLHWLEPPGVKDVSVAEQKRASNQWNDGELQIVEDQQPE